MYMLPYMAQKEIQKNTDLKTKEVLHLKLERKYLFERKAQTLIRLDFIIVYLYLLVFTSYRIRTLN